MSLAAFEGILSWKLTMDVGVWLVLLIRFAGYRKKEEISGEDMIWEIGILLFVYWDRIVRFCTYRHASL